MTAPKDFKSALKTECAEFIKWKRSLGYSYETEEFMLLRIDRFIADTYPDAKDLTREIVDAWCAKRETEHPRTHSSRVRCIKQFATYLIQRGRQAFVTDLPSESKARRIFRAHIYTSKELHMIFSYFDSIDAVADPLGSLQWPVVFRLFYSSGLRSCELRNLSVADFDQDAGTLFIRKTKFGKSRIIPLHPNMTRRISKYLENLPSRLRKSGVLFPANDGRIHERHSFFSALMKAVDAVGIPHAGKSKGVRVHDFRHTFAVRSLRQAFETNMKTTAFLPFLSAYMGHADMRGTEVYIQTTPEAFPEITRRFSAAYGELVPKGA